ncbi:MAG: hypothetical protein KJO82_04430, partial [Gammaproteobacteria bacterium]|nr:hypothetical protein [Gammaproteobacteria bacterium]
MPVRCHRIVVAAAALGALVAAAAARAQEPTSFISTGRAPPPGFEDLSGPQVTQVDVYFGGEFVTATMARFDFEAVELLAPREVVDAIPGVIEPDTVLAALSAIRRGRR